MASDYDKGLLIACDHGDLEQIQVCLQQGADINAASIIGNTPLIVAVKSGQIRIAIGWRICPP